MYIICITEAYSGFSTEEGGRREFQILVEQCVNINCTNVLLDYHLKILAPRRKYDLGRKVGTPELDSFIKHSN